MRRWFLKGVLAGSVGTAAVLVAAAAVAATVGDPFKLGQPNTINATSSLYGATAHDQLDVANLATGSSAKALGLLGRSATAPALNAANTGGGPALGLTVNSGKSPFTVNSPVKVANLNADQLDGLDSKAFAQGAGMQVLAKRIVLNAGSPIQTFLTIPGLGRFEVICSSNSSEIDWINSSGGPVDIWEDNSLDGSSQPGYYTVAAASNSSFQIAYSVQTSQIGTTVSLGKGSQPGTRVLAVVHAFALQSGLNAPCSFQLTANVWNAP